MDYMSRMDAVRFLFGKLEGCLRPVDSFFTGSLETDIETQLRDDEDTASVLKFEILFLNLAALLTQ